MHYCYIFENEIQQDMNTADKVKTLFWIVATLKKYGPITLKDINSIWSYHPLCDGNRFDRNTFRNYLNNIQEIFGISIDYKRSGYFIDSTSVIESKNFQKLLVSHVQDIDFYTRFRKLGDKLQTDDIPGGAEHLEAIGKALTDNLRLRMQHQKFADDTSKHLTVEPYCIKTKDRRWYLLARNVETSEMRTYALDRILELELTEEHFIPDSRINIGSYYSNCIGVYSDDTTLSEVTLKVTDFQAKYLRTLPLHPSQEEIAPCTFRYHIDVTPDLVNKILEMGSNATVLHPESLRKTVMDEIEKMRGNYRNSDKPKSIV